MADELAINVSIADRTYRLFVKRDEEEAVRKAVKLIDEQVSRYANSYNYNDKQNLLAMVALHFATLSTETASEMAFVNEKLYDTLQGVDQTLTNALKQNQST